MDARQFASGRLCKLQRAAAEAAYHLGFRRILVMHGGDKEWVAEDAIEGFGVWGLSVVRILQEALAGHSHRPE